MKKLVRLHKRPCKGGREFKYTLIWFDENGKERWKALGHADERKAESQRAQKERELRMGIVEPGSMKLSDMLEDYLQSTRGQVVPSTLVESKRAMTEFISEVGDIQADSVKFQHGEKFLLSRLDKGNRRGTVNKKLRHLHGVFAWARRRGLLERNPIHGIRHLRVTDRPMRVFSDAEVELLIEAAPNTLWQARILVARSAGLRIGELLNLTRQNIDVSEGIVMVEPKEETDNTWEWHPKDYEIRELPLCDRGVQLFLELQQQLPDAQPYALLNPKTYMRMLQRRAEGKLTYDDRRLPDRKYYNQFQTIVEGAQVAYGTMHDLRRAAITSWAENPNLQPHEVMKLAGHSSLETTLKYYVQTRRSIVNRARPSANPIRRRVS